MSFTFSQALSGLDAAAQALDVAGNNISNANTTGFKRSRVSFADVYANSISSAANNPIGLGVGVESVSRIFSQGGLTNTGNPLDVGISGDGFFVVRDPRAPEEAYTRAGQFGVDNGGFLVTSGGQRALGFLADSSGRITANAGQELSELRVDIDNLPSKETSQVDVRFNLNADADVIPNTGAGSKPFDPANPTTYNNTNSLTVFDAVGGSHTLTLYFKRIATGPVASSADTGGSRWEVYSRLDSGLQGFLGDNPLTEGVVEGGDTVPVGQAGTEPRMLLEFDGSGKLSGWAVNSIQTSGMVTGPADYSAAGSRATPGSHELGADGGDSLPVRGTVYLVKQTNSQSLPEMNLSFNLPAFGAGAGSAATIPLEVRLTLGDRNSLTTQFVDDFSPQFLSQNGNSSGALSGFALDDGGRLVVRYDNGITAVKGQLAIANFRAPTELRSVGGNLFIATPESGEARRLPPGFVTENGRLGTVKPQTLEESNVDLTQELVKLIISQRLYQANAKTIQVQSETAQAILTVV